MKNLYCSTQNCNVNILPAVSHEKDSSIPRTVYTKQELVESFKDQIEILGLSDDWTVVRLGEALEESSSLSALGKYVIEIFKSGGVCILSSSVILPDNCEHILDGLSTFVVHESSGSTVSPLVFGTAPFGQSRSKLPPYLVSPNYNNELYIEDLAALSLKVNPEIVIFARSVFFPDASKLLSSGALLKSNVHEGKHGSQIFFILSILDHLTFLI